MSDDEYTPTTDEVRADYETACTRHHDSYLTGRSLVDAQEVHGARFDRMIESVRAEERERILTEKVDRVRTDRDALVERVEEAEAERDEARGKLDAVRALAEDSRRTGKRLSALEVCDVLDGKPTP